MENPFVLGWEEWVSIPSLGLAALKAKVDTGARTSALHASAIETFGTSARPQVRFLIQPNPDDPSFTIICAAPVIDRRSVTSSNGESEMRYVIRVPIQIGERSWETEVTLTNRETMTYRMLLGRAALDDDMVIDPNRSFAQPALSFDLYRNLPRKKPPKRPLRIALLTREPDNYSSRRLVEAAEARGHGIEAVNTTRCYLKMGGITPEVHYDGKRLPRYDAVIPRIGASVTSYGMAVLRQFAATGAYCLNTADAIGASRDKLLAHQLLAQSKIGTPLTAFAHSPKDTKPLVELVGGSPAVVKLLSSTQGKGVVLAETRKAAESLIDAFRGLNADFLIQEFIAEAAGADLRCFVIGNKVVGAMRREAPDGEFRSNLHRGGSAKRVRVTKPMRDIARRSSQVLGLSVAGVDILESEEGPKVLEVNSSPGLEGIEKATGKKIAEMVIEHIEGKVTPLAKTR